MQNFLRLVFSDKKTIVLFTFFVALTVRLLLLPLNHSKNDFIDLAIIRETGQLVNTGINIYNYSDGKEIRERLRVDNIAHDDYVSGSQEAWDYYAACNLPMTSIFWGTICKISGNNPLVFRIVFSFFDCLLSALIALILVRYWQIKPSWFNLALILGLGALSPTLIFWGSVNPEDKGLQTLLMLSAIYFAKNNKWILSAVLLGLSVAFKGLGVFVAPLCLFIILGEPKNFLKISRPQILKGLAYTLLAIFFTIVWFIPYLPDVITMMKDRLASNTGRAEPAHGSIWTIFFASFPGSWFVIKQSMIVIFSVIWAFVFIFRKINITAISLFVLVLFVDIMLMQGSLDRMNIGIMVSMIVFGFVDLKFSKILAWYSIFIGWCLFIFPIYQSNTNNMHDALYTLGYVILFCSYPIIYLISNRKALPVIERNKEN
jgi:hypothetical protein